VREGLRIIARIINEKAKGQMSDSIREAFKAGWELRNEIKALGFETVYKKWNEKTKAKENEDARNEKAGTPEAR
jgi:hypothetical protein